jgi:succinoglycan biosynthesis protein ExoA
LKPFISVIIPCRNEAAFLGKCLDSVLASDYPANRMEVIVADGMSTDGTRDLLAGYSRRFTNIRMIDNPRQITPAGLNRAIEASQGQIIARVDAHAAIASDYLSRAVEHLIHDGADNVGGPMRTLARGPGWFAAPIRMVLSHPFGVGNSHFRTLSTQGAAAALRVDTVFGGCWRRDVFARIGTFNEKLARGQDLELNLRLLKSGGKILLAPDIRSSYFARTTLRSFCSHNWNNGVWAILPIAYSGIFPVRLRHLAPMIFVAALLVAMLIASRIGSPWPAIGTAGPYTVACVHFSGRAAYKERNLRLFALLPVTFLALHLTYGAGSLWGGLRLAGVLLARWTASLIRLVRCPVPRGTAA